MKTLRIGRSRLENQQGLMTLDFAFAIVMVFAFSAVLFGITFSLSVVEVVQYISFASARNYYAAHVSKEKQVELARAKYDQLSKNPAWATLFQNGWFSIPPANNIQVADFTDEYGGTKGDRNSFEGVRIPFTANILEMNFPLFGSTAGDEGFTANIATYLMREPSTMECMGVNQNRLNAIKTNLGYTDSNIDLGAYTVMGDNGC